MAGRARNALLLVLAGPAAVAACGSAPESPPPDAPGTVKVAARDFPLEPRRTPGADPAGPVTHVGRTVLPKCHRMVVGTVVGVTPAGPGTEVVRVRETEVLWGPRGDDGGEPTRVLCGARGLAPAEGGTALFLLRFLPAGEYEALEVAPLDDGDGPARLRAFRTYLRIEAVGDPVHRRALFLAYLRAALSAEDAWTRANAVREYAAFADTFPGALGREDGAALSAALPEIRDPNLRRLAQRALDGAAAVREPRRPAAARGGTPTEAPDVRLAGFERRFDEATKDARSRSDAVLEAAAALDRGAAPLVERALADRDPEVREAAAAAAGETGLTDLGPKLVPLAGADPSAAVRRTSVVALGHLRCEAAVGTLAGLARSDAALEREALFALARIRDDAAMARLRSHGDGAPAETRRLVDFLLSEDFVRQERALGAAWATGR